MAATSLGRWQVARTAARSDAPNGRPGPGRRRSARPRDDPGRPFPRRPRVALEAGSEARRSHRRRRRSPAAPVVELREVGGEGGVLQRPDVRPSVEVAERPAVEARQVFGLTEVSARRRGLAGGRLSSARRVRGEGIHLHHPRRSSHPVAGREDPDLQTVDARAAGRLGGNVLDVRHTSSPSGRTRVPLQPLTRRLLRAPFSGTPGLSQYRLCPRPPPLAPSFPPFLAAAQTSSSSSSPPASSASPVSRECRYRNGSATPEVGFALRRPRLPVKTERLPEKVVAGEVVE